MDLASSGSRLLLGDRDGHVIIWDLMELKAKNPGKSVPARLLAQLPYEANQVSWVTGSELAIGEGLDSTLRLWDTRSGGELRAFEHKSPPPLFALSPDGSTVVTVGSGRIRLWEVSSGRELRTFTPHEHFTLAFAYSPDGRTLASGGDRGLVILRSVIDGQEKLRIKHPEKSLKQISFSPDGRVLATIGFGKRSDSPVRLWNPVTGARINELRVSRADIKSFAFSFDGRFIAAAGSDHQLHLWELPSGRKITSVSINSGHPKKMTVGSDGTLYLAAGKQVTLWDLTALASVAPEPSNQFAIVRAPDDPKTGITHVKTAGELLGSIGSGKTLQLAPGIYNLSKVRWRDLPHVTWRPVVDGEEIVLHDLRNITLRGVGDQSTVIIADPRDAAVLSFERVKGLRLENLEFRHATRRAECTGGVLSLVDARQVTINHCQLLGSGSEGLVLKDVKRLRFVNSEIRQCTVSVMQVTNSRDLLFEDSRFVDNGALYGPAFSYQVTSGVSFKNVLISGNSENPSLFSLRGSGAIKVIDSEIRYNKADELVNALDGVQMVNTRVVENGFPAPLPEDSRFTKVDIAIGAAFRKERSISSDNSLFSGCDSRRVKVGDQVDLVDERGLLCRAAVTQVNGDGCMLSVEQGSCRSMSGDGQSDRSIEVFALHPSEPTRTTGTLAKQPNLQALEAALPVDVKKRLETSRAQAPQYLKGPSTYGIKNMGDADGDGNFDLMEVSVACSPGSEYTCTTVLVFEDGFWREAKRIGHL